MRELSTAVLKRLTKWEHDNTCIIIPSEYMINDLTCVCEFQVYHVNIKNAQVQLASDLLC